MKVAIYAPIALWEVHLAQAVEIAYVEQSKGNEVTIIHCQGSLASCAANMSHEEKKCRECRFQTKSSMKTHFPEQAKHVFLREKRIDVTLSGDISRLDTIEELKKFTYEGHPFGLSVLSHLVTEKRDWDLDFENIREKAIKILKNSIEHFNGMTELLEDRFDLVYIFGGRRPAEAFAAFAAKSKGITTKYFEHGSQAGKYWITENKFFTLRGIKEEISFWKENNWIEGSHLARRRMMGEEYFHSLRNFARKDPYFTSFLTGYHETPTISGTKPLMAVFTSSLWEFAGFDEELDCPVDFRNQYELYERLGMDQDLLEKFEIVFRWHPALKLAGNFEKGSMNKVIERTTQCIHIKPNEPVSSYDLMTLADVLVTIGSTIGIEGAAAGKPSILLGNASYSGLGSVYEPKTYEEFKKLVEKIPPALSREGALIYGDWVSNYGIDFQFVSRNGVEYFRQGSRIEKRTLVYRLRRWFFEQRKRYWSVR